MRIYNPRTPKEKKSEIISAYLTGNNSYKELGEYYGIEPSTIRTWVSRFSLNNSQGTKKEAFFLCHVDKNEYL